MAEHLETPDADVPPASEAIHMPEPSYLPVVFALGVTIALVGILMNILVIAIGVILVAVSGFRWIGQARAEMSELPLEHPH